MLGFLLSACVIQNNWIGAQETTIASDAKATQPLQIGATTRKPWDRKPRDRALYKRVRDAPDGAIWFLQNVGALPVGVTDGESAIRLAKSRTVGMSEPINSE